MTRVLVTGGTGVLGRAVVPHLVARGAQVRVLSRHERPSHGGVEWAKGDLSSGSDLPSAFHQVDVVVHCATSMKAKEDVAITRRVIEAAKAAKVEHALYVSIVGIDPLGFFDYYAAKLEGERLFAASGMPHSIQRATQFHDFVASLLSRVDRSPLLVLPRSFVVQPVDPQAVGVRVAEAALGQRAGRLPDLAGPEVRSLQDLAAAWLDAHGKRKRIVTLPLLLSRFKAMGNGQLTSKDAERVGRSWEAWLNQHVPVAGSDGRARIRGTS